MANATITTDDVTFLRQWWTPPNYASHDDPGYWADAPHAKGKA